tara:strand:- start:3274 stop:3465 length:192 start_codon:yes stop_codon:yes gene_type:complete
VTETEKPKKRLIKLKESEKIEAIYWAHYKNLPEWRRSLVDKGDEKEKGYLAKQVVKYMDEKLD